jgi:tRNA pseudouridine55 synthase
MPNLTGFLLINKPTGISSFGCIYRLKKIIAHKIKIGHAGTLDPFASGLLIVAIGREATRLMPKLMVLRKTYIATAKLGELTDTLDVMGQIVKTCDVAHVTEKKLSDAVQSFGPSYEQTPPLYSALKHQGMSLYKLARQKTVTDQELQKIAHDKRKTVQLYDVRLLSCTIPFFTIEACVSHGTYIRSFMNDIAMRVDCCATTHQLERTAIGPWTVKEAVAVSAINSINDIYEHLIPVESFDSCLSSSL